MTSIHDCARLANDVYATHPLVCETPTEIATNDATGPLPDGWHSLCVDSQMTPSMPVYLRLYIQVRRTVCVSAVIAIRGTNNINNVLTDCRTWFDSVTGTSSATNYPHHYMAQVYTYIEKATTVLSIINKNRPGKILITGHSLGGALAMMLSAQHVHLSTVAFNAPGVADLIKPPGPSSTILAINSLHGIINKIGRNLPQVSMSTIIVPEQDHEAEKLIDTFIKKGKSQFLQGKIEYQHRGIWGKTKGLYDIVSGLEASSSAFEDNPAYRRAQKICEYSPFFFATPSHLCEVEVEGRELTLVISAQHSMLNLLNALSQSRYHALAATPV